ncbi:MAG: hypothetical protein ACLP1Y_13050 [Candidatus Acidiferrales bacterium]
MSTDPIPTESKDHYIYEPTALPRWVHFAFIGLALLVAILFYIGYSERSKLEAQLTDASHRSDVISAEVDQANSRVADLRGKLEVTTQKLGLTQDELARARTLAETIRQQQKDSDQKLAAQIGQVQQESNQKIGAVSTDLSGTKTDLNATKQDLEAIKAKLTTAVGDISGQGTLIARNEEEVEALKRLNERNIFDFNIKKSKQPSKVGPIQLRLEKTDAKHYKYTVTVIADDRAVPKTDKTVDEPVQFRVGGSSGYYEIVVFDVGKDTIKGYLSTPKESGPAPAAPTPPKAQ